jgi:hypothetical protein
MHGGTFGWSAPLDVQIFHPFHVGGHPVTEPAKTRTQRPRASIASFTQ